MRLTARTERTRHWCAAIVAPRGIVGHRRIARLTADIMMHYARRAL